MLTFINQTASGSCATKILFSSMISSSTRSELISQIRNKCVPFLMSFTCYLNQAKDRNRFRGGIHLVLEFVPFDLASIMKYMPHHMTDLRIKCYLQQLLRGIDSKLSALFSFCRALVHVYLGLLREASDTLELSILYRHQLPSFVILVCAHMLRLRFVLQRSCSRTSKGS